jgi:hypothetical protein
MITLFFCNGCMVMPIGTALKIFRATYPMKNDFKSYRSKISL